MFVRFARHGLLRSTDVAAVDYSDPAARARRSDELDRTLPTSVAGSPAGDDSGYRGVMRGIDLMREQDLEGYGKLLLARGVVISADEPAKRKHDAPAQPSAAEAERPPPQQRRLDAAAAAASGTAAAPASAAPPAQARPARAARAKPTDFACRICRKSNPAPTPTGCACRGRDGLAHFECLAAEAAALEGVHGSSVWWVCRRCGNDHTRRTHENLAQRFAYLTLSDPDDSDRKYTAAWNRAKALFNRGHFGEAQAMVEAACAVLTQGRDAAAAGQAADQPSASGGAHGPQGPGNAAQLTMPAASAVVPPPPPPTASNHPAPRSQPTGAEPTAEPRRKAAAAAAAAQGPEAAAQQTTADDVRPKRKATPAAELTPTPTPTRAPPAAGRTARGQPAPRRPAAAAAKPAAPKREPKQEKRTGGVAKNTPARSGVAKTQPKKSKYVYVTWHQGMWRAGLWHNGEWVYLQHHDSERAAANAADRFLRRHGRANDTNFDRQGNLRARPRDPSKSSKYRGVKRDKRTGNWSVSIKVDGRLEHKGVFAVEEDAAREWDRWAKPLGRELNFPP